MGNVVRIASFICAGGRANLMDAARIAGVDNVFYCDTDSLDVNTEGKFRLTIAGLVDAKVLGKLKQEKVILSAIYLSRKNYMHK